MILKLEIGVATQYTNSANQPSEARHWPTICQIRPAVSKQL